MRFQTMSGRIVRSRGSWRPRRGREKFFQSSEFNRSMSISCRMISRVVRVIGSSFGINGRISPVRGLVPQANWRADASRVKMRIVIVGNSS